MLGACLQERDSSCMFENNVFWLQAAAGMGIFGPRTVYCIALKDAPGTHEFLLQDDGKWMHVKETTEIGKQPDCLVSQHRLSMLPSSSCRLAWPCTTQGLICMFCLEFYRPANVSQHLKVGLLSG